MHTFFYGWRRKTGVALLVMACGLTVMWARSQVVVDSINFEVGNQLYIVWSAPDGCFAALWDRMPAELRGPGRQGFCEFSWSARTPKELMMYYGHPVSMNELVRAAESDHPNDWYLVLQYQWVVLSLAAICTYLIFWKPRKRQCPN